MLQTLIDCPLAETVANTATDYWNDSCSIKELTYAIERGAVGATSNPSIVLDVLKQEIPLWRERIFQMIAENPTWTEEQVTWQLTEEMAIKGAELLQPIFEGEQGRKGRLSIQTNPTFYRDAQRLAAQAVHFNTLAPNMQVKIAVTEAGVQAIEEATFAGVSINATVCFSVPQALAVGAAVERGLLRREAAGLDTAHMSPVCTIMIGRLDDWLQVTIKRDGILADPGLVHWAGIAAFKKAYAIYHERGYRARLLAAAYRHVLHWTELVGGDIVLTIPYPWQKLFNESGITPVERMHLPVDQRIVDELYAKFPDFRRAYDVDGMTDAEFDRFGPTVRTLRAFIDSYHQLQGTVREFMLPNPDVKPTADR